MKKIGIIGGLGPESTVLYYREILKQYQAIDDRNTPVILIYSINNKEFFRCQEQEEHAFQLSILQKAVDSLTSAGADVVVIAANTPHMFYNDLSRHSKVPMISIVDETARETLALSVNKKTGLFGTSYTMEGDFYPEAFRKHGLEVVVPDKNDRKTINQIIYTELINGTVYEHSRNKLFKIIDSMAAREGVDTLILGCTELPLILEGEHNGIILLDTIKIHVRAIVDFCTGKTA